MILLQKAWQISWMESSRAIMSETVVWDSIFASHSLPTHMSYLLWKLMTQCGKKSWRKYQLTCYYLNLQLSITRLDFMLFYTSEDLPFGSLLMAFVIVICVYQTKGFFLQNGGCKSPMRLVSIGVELIVSLLELCD